jgi:hypothetical protein
MFMLSCKTLKVIVIISYEMVDLLSDILKYDLVMLSERGDWKPPGRWTGHRYGAVHPVAMTTRGNFALPARERCAAVTPAVAARVSRFDSPAKDGAGDGFRCTLAPWDGRGPPALVAQRRDLSVTGKELHRIRQYLLLIHIQRGSVSRDKMDNDHDGTIVYLTNTPSGDSRQ